MPPHTLKIQPLVAVHPFLRKILDNINVSSTTQSEPIKLTQSQPPSWPTLDRSNVYSI